MGGEGLARGPADVLATLLHEAAHVRGVKGTSKVPRLGWSRPRSRPPPAPKGAKPRISASHQGVLTIGHCLTVSVSQDVLLGSARRPLRNGLR
jgi:hypothetical protein